MGMIAEQVKFSDLRPNAPFYMVNPHTVKRPSVAQVHYTCENIAPDTAVWVLYEDWRGSNPWVKSEPKSRVYQKPGNKPFPPSLGMWLINSRSSTEL